MYSSDLDADFPNEDVLSWVLQGNVNVDEPVMIVPIQNSTFTTD